MAKQIVGFDVTISCAKEENYMEVGKALAPIFKKFVFQQEEGEGGYKHWQVRGHLFKQKTEAQAINQFADKLWNGHWSVTSTAVHSSNGKFNYCMKEDSRIDGPWKEGDEAWDEAPVATKQLKEMMEKPLLPFQEKIIEIAKQWDTRLIHVVICKQGNVGKSMLCELMEFKKLAYEIPPMNDMQDIMQCCMGIRPQKCYLIDMPKAMKKEKLAGFYAGLESLKNGVCYDKRYAFKKRRMDRPQIIVFTNCHPDSDLLSADRWKIWNIEDFDLKEP